MRKVTVIEPVHLRPAVDSNEWADKLSPGDQLEYLEERGQWIRGRVSFIKSHKFSADRIGKIGWVWRKAVSVEPPSSPPSPSPPPRPTVAAGVVTIFVILLIVGIFAFVWL